MEDDIIVRLFIGEGVITGYHKISKFGFYFGNGFSLDQTQDSPASYSHRADSSCHLSKYHWTRCSIGLDCCKYRLLQYHN